MDQQSFNEIADLALRTSGQAWHPEKQYLMEARLSHILRRENFSDIGELAACMQARPNPVLADEVTSALTGKTTGFFSDRDTLKRIVGDVLPRLSESVKTTDPLRVLCAGGGTGQEAYSLTILLHEAGPEYLSGRDVEIVSIDICKASTARAEAGIYGHFEVQTGLSVHRMLEHFTGIDGRWQISETMRNRVSFQVANLREDLSGLGHFDVILCRSILPGMAEPIARETVERLGKL
ncbi:MAG: CheR family methyltransferase, partial [Pseudomonadota bacterium]